MSELKSVVDNIQRYFKLDDENADLGKKLEEEKSKSRGTSTRKHNTISEKYSSPVEITTDGLVFEKHEFGLGVKPALKCVGLPFLVAIAISFICYFVGINVSFLTNTAVQFIEMAGYYGDIIAEGFRDVVDLDIAPWISVIITAIIVIICLGLVIVLSVAVPIIGIILLIVIGIWIIKALWTSIAIALMPIIIACCIVYPKLKKQKLVEINEMQRRWNEEIDKLSYRDSSASTNAKSAASRYVSQIDRNNTEMAQLVDKCRKCTVLHEEYCDPSQSQFKAWDRYYDRVGLVRVRNRHPGAVHIYDYFVKGRVETIKEAINLYHTEKKQDDLESMQRYYNESAERDRQNQADEQRKHNDKMVNIQNQAAKKAADLAEKGLEEAKKAREQAAKFARDMKDKFK